MNTRHIISQELIELNSTLPPSSVAPVQTVPTGYFEGLADRVLARIREEEACLKEALESVPLDNAADPLLSPLLESLRLRNPYEVPARYFEELDPMPVVGEEPELPAMLQSLRTELTFQVPDGYFERLSPDRMTADPTGGARVVSMTSSPASGKRTAWLRYAAAAVVIGIIATTGYLFYRPSVVDTSGEEMGIANVVRELPAKTIDSFLLELDPLLMATMSGKDSRKVKELMKNVPEKEIDAFLNEAGDFESDLVDDILLN